MSAITTYILDTTTGLPGNSISANLEYKQVAGDWQVIAHRTTDADGRVNDFLVPNETLMLGYYRLVFETGPYYLLQGVDCFFPQIVINFVVKDPRQHYHIPLLLSPFGYSVYRGR